jgi:manganese efflux pump family protein
MIGSIAVASAHTVVSSGHALAVAALVSWLVAESLGAWMLRRWLVSGGTRRPRHRDAASPPVLFGHASLALAGLTSWVIFLATRSDAAAWLAIGFLAPAIGLGVSTVTTWTPYPVRPLSSAQQPARPVPVPPEDPALRRALENDALTGQLVDDLLARMLAEPRPAVQPRWRLAMLIPAVHGVAAIATVLLTVLAAVGSIGT